jgi:hypothetical protein
MSSLSAQLAVHLSPRINQLDAAMLDNEITQHLSEQLKSALSYVPYHHFNLSSNTLTTAAEILLLLFTTGRQLPTPGQSMLYVAPRTTHAAFGDMKRRNIRLSSERQASARSKIFSRRRSSESVAGLSAKRRVAFMLLSCVVPLATDAVIARLAAPFSANESERARACRQRLRNFLVAARNVARFLGVVNSFAFIRHGQFRTLPARVAGGCSP